MLYLSLGGSFILLVVTCGAVWLMRHDLWNSQVAWVFLIFGIFGMMLPTYLLNVVLVAVGGLICAFASVRPRFFYGWTLLATLLSYAVGSYFAYDYVHDAERQFPMESMAQRLNYESKRGAAAQRGGWAAEEPLNEPASKRLADLEESLDVDEVAWRNMQRPRSWRNRTHVLQAIHDAQVQQFVNSPGFGVIRMPLNDPYYAKRPEEFVIPQELPDKSPSPLGISAADLRSLTAAERSAVTEPFDKLVQDSWYLHSKSVLDFSNPAGFGYIRDRDHVAGFQAHQFSKMPDRSISQADQHWTLKRVELVSLLTHDKPGVYVTNNLPRMDLLRDVPVRPLDEFEQTSLPQLGLGEDVIALQTSNRLRVLGAIRAGKQCLSCHDAQRGALLGAFSYHFDPVR